MHTQRLLAALSALLLTWPLAGAQAAGFSLADTWVFGGHKGEVVWGTLTPDDKRVYTQSGAQLFSWDAATGQLIASLEPASGQPLRVLGDDLGVPLAPQGQRLLVSVGEGAQAHVQVLELATGRLSGDLGVLSGGASPQWTPQQAAVVLSTYESPQVRYWRQGSSGPNAQVGTLTLDIKQADAGEQRATFSPDAQVLYVFIPNDTQGLQAYDPATGHLLWQRLPSEVLGRDGKPLRTWKFSYMSPQLSHNPARPQLLLTSADGLLLLSTQDKSPPLWLEQDFNKVTSIYRMTWSDDGSRLFITTGDFVHEIDTATGKTLRVFDGVGVLAQTPERLWTRGWNKVMAFDRATGFDIAALSDVPAWNSPLALNNAGEPEAALLKGRQGLSVYTYASGHQTLLSDHFSRVAHFSPNGALVASVGPAAVQVMDRRTHQVLWRAAAQNSYEATFSPDGKVLALGEGWQTRLLDTATGQELATLKAPEAASNAGARGLNRALAFSPDSHSLLIGYEAGAAAVWDVAARKVTATLSAGKGWVLSAAFSPDGRRVALGSGSGEVRTFGLASGDLHSSMALDGAVRALAFGPDGSLAAGSLSGELRRWDSAGKLTFTQKGAAGITALSFAGADLLTGDANGLLTRYDASGKVAASLATGSLIQSLDWNKALGNVLVSSRDNTLHTYALSSKEQP